MKVFSCFLLILVCALAQSPLFDYVNTPDPNFSWKLVSSERSDEGYTNYNLFLTSQAWMKPSDFIPPNNIWTHWLQVTVPDFVDPSCYAGLIYIDGGRSANINSPPTKTINPLTVLLALETACPTAELSAIPNQPLVFASDPIKKSRTEDALIAFTWRKFMNESGKDPYWLARMPMTKASVRAMDAMQAFLNNKNQFPHVPTITNFVMAGASKRGWTTWTTAVVTNGRTIGAVPIVAPVGDVVTMMNEMYEAYDGWSFALQDYIDEGITAYVNTPIFAQLLSIISPLSYIQYLKMPKFPITSIGDEFFMPTAPGLYVQQLDGPTFMRMLPNAEHSCAGHAVDLATNVAAFTNAIVYKHQFPTYNWTITYSPDNLSGAITLTIAPNSPVKPNKVIMWHAHTKGPARDFRLIVCGDIKNISCLHPIISTNTELSATGPGSNVYVGKQSAPSEGWLAFWVEMEYDIGDVSRIDPFKPTTAVAVVPNTYPYPACPTSQCGGPNGPAN